MDGIDISDVDRVREGIIVNFSDGTTAIFTAKELYALRLDRAPIKIEDDDGDLIA